MSEVSNISKTSLPNSVPPLSAASKLSKAFENKQASQTNSLSNMHQNLNKQISSSAHKPLQSSSNTSIESSKRATVSNASKNLLQLSQSASKQQPSITNLDAKKQQQQPSGITNPIFKKPGQVVGNKQQQPHALNSKTIAIENVAEASKSSLLHINTANLESSSASSKLASSSSPSTVSSASSAKSKTELKLNNQIKLLNALCESRTKELSRLKIELKQNLVSFDAITVAFNYLSNNLNGFEAPTARRQLRLNQIKHDERVNTIRTEIDAKEEELRTVRDQLCALTKESDERVQELQRRAAEMEKEHNIQAGFMKAEHELLVKSLSEEKDLKLKALNKSMETMRSEHEKDKFEWSEQLESKINENVELERRVRECEETLAKDKDERFQRLLDAQHNLEKEIESLKAAIDIKNTDLFELRARNNELTTKVDNYNELNMKLRRYRQEVEQLNAILKNKQDAER